MIRGTLSYNCQYNEQHPPKTSQTQTPPQFHQRSFNAWTLKSEAKILLGKMPQTKNNSGS